MRPATSTRTPSIHNPSGKLLWLLLGFCSAAVGLPEPHNSAFCCKLRA